MSPRRIWSLASGVGMLCAQGCAHRLDPASLTQATANRLSLIAPGIGACSRWAIDVYGGGKAEIGANSPQSCTAEATWQLHDLTPESLTASSAGQPRPVVVEAAVDTVTLAIRAIGPDAEWRVEFTEEDLRVAGVLAPDRTAIDLTGVRVILLRYSTCTAGDACRELNLPTRATRPALERDHCDPTWRNIPFLQGGPRPVANERWTSQAAPAFLPWAAGCSLDQIGVAGVLAKTDKSAALDLLVSPNQGGDSWPFYLGYDAGINLEDLTGGVVSLDLRVWGATDRP